MTGWEKLYGFVCVVDQISQMLFQYFFISSDVEFPPRNHIIALKLCPPSQLAEFRPSCDVYASPIWMGASVTPGPKGNPGEPIYAMGNQDGMVGVDRATPSAQLTMMYGNQDKVYHSLARERERQLSRAFGARIYGQSFQERAPAREVAE